MKLMLRIAEYREYLYADPNDPYSADLIRPDAPKEAKMAYEEDQKKLKELLKQGYI